MSLDKLSLNAIIKISSNAKGVEGTSNQCDVFRERPGWWKGCIQNIDENQSGAVSGISVMKESYTEFFLVTEMEMTPSPALRGN